MPPTSSPSGSAPLARAGHRAAPRLLPRAQPSARRWLRPAAATLAVAWGANMFAAILQTYRGALSPVQVTGLFGAYALGLIPAVLVMARVADRLGRRVVLIAALLLSVLGTAVLAVAADRFGLLLVGRVVVGLSAGAAFAPATAWIKELTQAAEDEGRAGAGSRPGRGALRASTALTAGFAVGPLVSGAIVQASPSLRPAAYALQVVLVLIALPLVWTTSETTRRTGTPTAAVRLPRARNGRAGGAAAPSTLRRTLRRRVFLAGVLPTAPWVFGAATTALGALPVLVPLGRFGPLGSGVVAAVTLGTGILVQPVAQRLVRRGPTVPLQVGTAAVVLGMLTAALTVATASRPLLLLSAVVLGSAYGLLLTGGLGVVHSIAAPQDAATVTGVFYALTYLGFAAPVLVPALSRLWSAPLVLVAAAVFALLSLAATVFARPTRLSHRA
ncbi:MFS transporter [Kineococcus rhizosphaerae]|uniref:Putative MFS family arabinose efflux permease n=1 Tax=Kineococcus rhizosphaerae TaxID=559628 RepID=A0A2T0QXH7_9ACTN|nr:MFS transporter [Kineococcus rhizosphaerae]PRY10576.1 putative MFS family arabinose efflux permease [Kineococcus rhizosphaerae]